MTIIRGACEGDRVVTVLRAAAQDRRLSYRARGLLLACLSRPRDWSTDGERLAAEGREGEHAVLAALRELATYGYLRRGRVRLPSGRITTEWVISDDPRQVKAAPQPSTEPRKPRGGKPRGGKPRGDSPGPGNPRPLLEGETEPPPPTSSTDGTDQDQAKEEEATAVTDAARRVRGHIPPGAHWASVAKECRRLLRIGWTADDLEAAACSHGWAGAGGGAGVAWLRDLDGPPEGRQGGARRPAWCGRCEEPTRMINRPDGRVQRCPDCHPMKKEGT